MHLLIKLDRLPALLRIWSSNVLPDSYAVDVVTMTHVNDSNVSLILIRVCTL